MYLFVICCSTSGGLIPGKCGQVWGCSHSVYASDPWPWLPAAVCLPWHAWSSQGGSEHQPMFYYSWGSLTQLSNIRSASDNKLHPGISTAPGNSLPQFLEQNEWDSEAVWNRLISRTLSVRDAECKLHRHLFTVFGRSSGLIHTPVGSVNGETGRTESGYWLSLVPLVASSGLPLSLQKWLRHLWRRRSHSLTMWPWKALLSFRHFPISEMKWS